MKYLKWCPAVSVPLCSVRVLFTAHVFVQSDRMAAACLAESCSREAPHCQSVGCERQRAEAFDCSEESCGGLVSVRKDSLFRFSARSAASHVTHRDKKMDKPSFMMHLER